MYNRITFKGRGGLRVRLGRGRGEHSVTNACFILLLFVIRKPGREVSRKMGSRLFSLSEELVNKEKKPEQQL